MQTTYEATTLERDCEAIRIPEGTMMTLPAGTKVRITQTLGGTYTVMTDIGALARIAGEDADALGLEVVAGNEESSEDKPLDEQVFDCLRTIYDPEIPVNIVELGLIYRCDVTDAPAGGYDISIDMTLTAPGCGMGEVLAADVRRKVLALRDVRHAEINVVFDPPWDQRRMSEAARLELGML